MYNYYPIDFTWNTEMTQVCLPIMLALLSFIAFWFISHSEQVKAYFLNKNDADTASLKHFLYMKSSGFIVFGIIPLILCLLFIPNMTIEDYGLNFSMKTLGFTLIWAVGLSIIVIPFVNKNAKNPANYKIYPQIKSKKWNKNLMIKSLIGWLVYLLGYELLFRGVLLFPLLEQLGLWPAITINTALYSATHIPKGLNEALSAIPFGIILCLLTIASGNIIIAVVVHIAIAWTNNLATVMNHPEITYTQ